MPRKHENARNFPCFRGKYGIWIVLLSCQINYTLEDFHKGVKSKCRNKNFKKGGPLHFPFSKNE